MHTEYCVLNKAHEDVAPSTTSFKKIVHYKYFRSAWYAFLNLLDINFLEGFQCATCGVCPQVVVMDATALSFRRELGFWNSDVPSAKSSIAVPKGR